MYPNFLIAGGVATGTSFLSATLINHTDIYLPRIQRPEPNFFHYTDKYEMGLNWYLDKWFSEVKSEKAVGERSSLLMTSVIAARRLHMHFPDIKLIFCLRNPIERAWGNYRFSVLEGLEELSFEDALASENKRVALAAGRWKEVQPHAYVTRSCYAEPLSEYLKMFGRKQILFIKSEEMGRDPSATLTRVCRFLGVDEQVSLPLPANYTSPSVRDALEQRHLRDYFGDRYPDLIELIRVNADLSDAMLCEDDREHIERLKRNLTTGKAPMPESCRKHLRGVLADEIRKIGELAQIPVDDWV